MISKSRVFLLSATPKLSISNVEMSPLKHKIQGYKSIRKSYDKMWEEVKAEVTVPAQDTAGDNVYMGEASMDDQGDGEWEEVRAREENNEEEGMDKKATKEGTTHEDGEEGATYDDEEKADAVLSETFALSDLLELEQEQPDDLFLPDSIKTPDQSERPTSPNAPSQSKRRRRNSRWDVPPLLSPKSPLPYDHEYEDLAPSEFVETEVAITKAEWSLSFLPPFCHHRARLPSPLRFCCTIIWEE